MPGHGYWLPDPVRVARGQRRAVPVFRGRGALEGRARHRIVVHAFTDELAGALRVRRLSTLTLERTGEALLTR